MKRITFFSNILVVIALASACTAEEQVRPKRMQVVDAVFATGQLMYEKEYRVVANTEGYLIDAFVEEGENVSAGRPLFRLSDEISSEQVSNAQLNYRNALQKLDPNSPDQIQARLQLEQADAQLLMDKKNFERHSSLLDSKAVSQMEYEKAELQYENSKRSVELKQQALKDLMSGLELSAANAQSQLTINQESNEDYFLSSKIDGIILQAFKQPGDLVRRGEVLAVVGGGSLVSRLYIAEEEINAIQLNQEVLINLNTERDTSYVSRVSRILPSFDTNEQSFIIEARFVEVPKTCFYNTQLQANIITYSSDDAMVIPSDYLSTGDSVQLANHQSVFVTIGLRNESWVEIKSGLTLEDVLIKPLQL